MKSTCCVMMLLLMVSLAGGCCVFGKNMDDQKFDAAGLDGLKAGQTTAQEVCKIFGAPSQIVELSNGNAYVYRRSVAKGTVVWLLLVSMGTYDKQYDQMVFFFDDNDVLTHYGASFNVGEASYGLPF